MNRPVKAVLAAIAAAFCCTPFALNAGAEEEPTPAFVVLGQTAQGEPVAMARILLAGTDAPCPSLEHSEGWGDMRAMKPRKNPDPDHFGVTVCEALYPTDGSTMFVSGTSIRLPPVPPVVSRIAVFGDTGCKPSDQKGCDTTGSRQWPFGIMANAATGASPSPDLILHMGDYNYRGTPGHIKVKGNKVRVYDAGDNAPNVCCRLSGPYYGQNSVGSESPDTWENWKADFFGPAENLLRAAPWIFARGNHELCSRAGPGWFYFLDLGSDLLEGSAGQLHCPPAESKEPLVFREPYRVDLGGLSVVVIDSANACDQGDLHQTHFDEQFASIQVLVKDAPDANAMWLQSHRPLWAVKKREDDTPKSQLDDSGKYTLIDATLQSAYASHPVPKQVHLVVSGHMHRFQAIDLETKDNTRLPSQLVIGNGGVSLAKNRPKAPFSLTFAGLKARGFGLSKFGYMDIHLKEDGAWKGRLLDDQGGLLAECDSQDVSKKTGICKPAD